MRFVFGQGGAVRDLHVGGKHVFGEVGVVVEDSFVEHTILHVGGKHVFGDEDSFVEHTIRPRHGRDVPRADVLRKGRGSREHLRHISDRRRVPIRDICVENIAASKHLPHRRHRRHVPRADALTGIGAAILEHHTHRSHRRRVPRPDVFIEIPPTVKQSRHVRHAPDVPRSDLPVPALRRGLVPEVFLYRRAQRAVRVAQVVLDDALDLFGEVVVGQGALALVCFGEVAVGQGPPARV
mmetsp:Transcript_20630/g.61531  ORF Transcript_20630/g.61531 Transcript_20630/m.61531 type:complete len:238 (-) Transcript_20630:141-854(-)